MNPPVLPGLFEVPVADIAGPSFDGATYQADRDKARLGAQLRRVAAVMAMGHWLTLEEIQTRTGDPQASISARIRDLRKLRYGGRDVEHRRRHGAGLWEYRLVVRP
jgi:hypothetical protein